MIDIHTNCSNLSKIVSVEKNFVMHHHAVAAGILGSIEGLVGCKKKRIGCFPVLGVNCNTGGERDLHSLLAKDKRSLAYTFTQLINTAQSIRNFYLRYNNNKFFTTKTTGKITLAGILQD